MRNIQIFIFITVVLVVYLLTNLYIYSGATRAFHDHFTVYKIFKFIFWIGLLSFVLGTFLDRIWYSVLSHLLNWIGTFWLGLMLYLFLSVLFLDITLLLSKVYKPVFMFLESYRFQILSGLFSLSALLIVVGFINAMLPRVKELNIELNGAQSAQYKLVLITDLHLGSQIGVRYLDKIIAKINAQKPDLVLFGGDIINDSVLPVEHQQAGKHFESIRSRLGIYAVTGNHEYIGNAAKTCTYLEKYGIVFLRDSVINVEDNFMLAGRDDSDKKRYAPGNVKAIRDMIPLANTLPVVLMDHQPVRIKENVEAGIGLQLSGHTHHGQLWPFNYITQAIFPISSGLKRFEKTWVYVSNGAGTWGPRVRLGNRPEIVAINLDIVPAVEQ